MTVSTLRIPVTPDPRLATAADGPEMAGGAP